MSRATLEFDAVFRQSLDPYLPPPSHESPAGLQGRPFVTLTYAASLDSLIAAAPGQRTTLSGPISKSMTHYLRYKHSAILVGSGTALADDPTLNSRFSDASSPQFQPQPVILDRRGRWAPSPESNIIRAARKGQGKAPWVLVGSDALGLVPQASRQTVEQCGGRFIMCDNNDWSQILSVLHHEGIESVMVEGGASVINSLLSDHADLVDSVIVTVAPVYLGQGGVAVSPRAARTFTKVQWLPLGPDAVMCARMPQPAPLNSG